MKHDSSILRGTLVVLAITASVTAALSAAEPLTMQVHFSTDIGKTWNPEAPLLRQSDKMKVKVGWQFADPTDSESGSRMVKLVCADGCRRR